MSFSSSGRSRIVGLTTAVTLLLAPSLAFAQNTIALRGDSGAACSIAVTPDAQAQTLPISVAGPHTTTVGTVTQTCNIFNGYTLTVTAANCAAAPTGAKLIEPGSGSNLAYSVSSTNPGPATVTGLLASACTSQVARDVTGAIVNNEISTIAVVYTGSASLYPGAYTDTLTFTMTTK